MPVVLWLPFGSGACQIAKVEAQLLGENQFSQLGGLQAIDLPAMLDADKLATVEQL